MKAENAGSCIGPNGEHAPIKADKRRLTFRFLTLPFRHQFAIAQSLNVLTDEDDALSNEVLFREVFKRAAAAGLIAKLWEETERRHPDPATFNPFESSK